MWVGLFEPSLAELSLIQSVFDLDQLQVDDAANHRQRPKVELSDRSAFVIMKLLSYYEKTSDVETGQIAIFLAEHFVITVRYGPLGDITGIRRRLESDPDFWRSVQPPWPTRSWMRPSMGTWPSPRKSHATSRSSRSPCSARSGPAMPR